MKKLFSSVAALAVVGSMTVAAPAEAQSARDIINGVRTGGQIYNNIERNRIAREREQLRQERELERLQAQRERDHLRTGERLDSQANNRCNQSERNQIAARGQDYRATNRAPAYRGCDPQVGPYGNPNQTSGRASQRSIDQEAQLQRDGEIRSSGSSNNSRAVCDTVTVRGVENLRCKEADGRVTLSPIAP